MAKILSLSSGLTLVAGMTIGLFAGGFAATKLNENFLENKSVLDLAVDVQQKIYILKTIRGGDIDKSIESLEIDLDGNIIGLSAYDRRNSHVSKSLVLAKSYRDKYPRETTNQMIDKAVQEVLIQK